MTEAPLAGMLVIDKPKGWTSMDVCARVRGLLRRGGAPKRVKVGHTGTLDPMATGVLVVLVGRATKLCERLMADTKVYEAEVDLSRVSDTDDAEGRTREVTASQAPSEDRVRAALAAFVGEAVMQRPPSFSALHVGGKRAYELARGGEVVELPARPVRIDSVRLDAYAYPVARLTITCGKGTYIRSIARDLGASLGTGGMLTALRRTRSGSSTLERARVLDGLPPAMTQDDLDAVPDFGQTHGPDAGLDTRPDQV